jgi:chaperonin GroES
LNKSSEGEVLAVGPGYRAHNGDLVPVSVTIGDKVLLPEFGGVQLKSEGDEIYLFRNDEILAKILA